MVFLNTDFLCSEELRLLLDYTAEADPVRDFVPAYHFKICLPDGTMIGRCDLRIGHTMSLFFGGNIGYAVDDIHRGHHYAAHACKLLFQLAAKHDLRYVFITCDPANHASARTCELANGRYLETAPISEDNEMYAEGKRQVMIWRFDFKFSEFLSAAARINEELRVSPLLFGSLGLEQRLGISLNSDDIDVLLPERFLNAGWQKMISMMNKLGYTLQDEEEHEFVKGDFRIAFASMENLEPFAGVDLKGIPLIREQGTSYYLLELPDYLRVYEASSRDGYRKNVKRKQDQQKINLILKAMQEENGH